MKILQRDIPLLLASILLVVIGLIADNSKIAMLIVLILALFAVLNKQLGLLMLLIYVPIRPFLITVNPGYKIIGDLIIFALLLRTVYDYRKNIKGLFSFNIFEYGFIAFIIIGAISAFITGVSMSAIIFQLRAYILFYFIFYIVKRMDINKEAIYKFKLITFILAVIISLQGIIEKITDKTQLMPIEWRARSLSPTNHMRVYGLLNGPNELSLFLVIAFFISLSLLAVIGRKYKVYIYVGLVLIGTTFLLTYSRGTVLCLGVFAVAYLIFYRNIRKVIPVILIAIFSFGLYYGVNQSVGLYKNLVTNDGTGNVSHEEPPDIDRYKNAFSEDTIQLSRVSGRLMYAKKALEVYGDHLIMGTGFATYGSAATLTYSSPIYDDYDIAIDFYSDNQYSLIIAETGTLGLIAILIVALTIGIFLWNIRKEYHFAPLLWFMFIAIIVGGLVYNILENDSFMFFFFTILGVAYKYRKEEIIE